MSIIQARADVEKFKNKLNNINNLITNNEQKIAKLSNEVAKLTRSREKTLASLKRAECRVEDELNSGYETPPDQPITYEPPKHTWGDFSDEGYVPTIGNPYIEEGIKPKLIPIAKNNALNSIMKQARNIDADITRIDYYNNVKRYEKTIDSHCMNRHPNINSFMRIILLNWIVEVHMKYKQYPETLHLTINIIDRYLSCSNNIERNKFQLLGVSAFFIASKIEEITPPDVHQMVYICDKAYTKNEITEMTFIISKKLNYNFQFVSPYTWVIRCFDIEPGEQKLVGLSCFILECAMLDIEIIEFQPSIIAASAVLIARRSYGISGWTPTLIKYIGYTGIQLQPCIECIIKFIEGPSTNNSPILKKYKSLKFDCPIF